jgi:hypothetical protein
VGTVCIYRYQSLPLACEHLGTIHPVVSGIVSQPWIWHLHMWVNKYYFFHSWAASWCKFSGSWFWLAFPLFYQKHSISTLQGEALEQADMSLLGRFEFKKMLSLYNGHVEFMEGSPVHQSDLERVCASHAAAIFLLANKQTNVGCCMLLKFLLHASVDHQHDSRL